MPKLTTAIFIHPAVYPGYETTEGYGYETTASAGGWGDSLFGSVESSKESSEETDENTTGGWGDALFSSNESAESSEESSEEEEQTTGGWGEPLLSSAESASKSESEEDSESYLDSWLNDLFGGIGSSKTIGEATGQTQSAEAYGSKSEGDSNEAVGANSAPAAVGTTTSDEQNDDEDDMIIPSWLFQRALLQDVNKRGRISSDTLASLMEQFSKPSSTGTGSTQSAETANSDKTVETGLGANSAHIRDLDTRGARRKGGKKGGKKGEKDSEEDDMIIPNWLFQRAFPQDNEKRKQISSDLLASLLEQFSKPSTTGTGSTQSAETANSDDKTVETGGGANSAHIREIQESVFLDSEKREMLKYKLENLLDAISDVE